MDYLSFKNNININISMIVYVFATLIVLILYLIYRQSEHFWFWNTTTTCPVCATPIACSCSQNDANQLALFKATQALNVVLYPYLVAQQNWQQAIINSQGKPSQNDPALLAFNDANLKFKAVFPTLLQPIVSASALNGITKGPLDNAVQIAGLPLITLMSMGYVYPNWK